MALIPRVAPVNTVAHIAGALAPAGLRNVAAVDRVPVEETGGSTATSLDSSILTQAYGRRATDRPQDRRDRHEARPIVIPPRTAGALIQATPTAESPSAAPATFGTRGFNGELARAIDTYETATEVINGTNARGAAVSFLL